MYMLTLGSFQFLFKTLHEGTERMRSAFWAAALLTALVSVAAIAVINFFGEPIAKLINLSDHQSELRLAVILTATTAVMMVFLFFHYGLGRNNFQNLLQFLRGSLWVLVAIAVGFFADLSLHTIMLIMNGCMVLILLLAFPWGEWKLLRPVTVDRREWANLLRYCLPLLPYYAGAWGIPMILRAQLNVFEGAREVAFFTVAYTLMEILYMFVSTISSTLSPYFYADSSSAGKPGLFYNIMLKYSILCISLIVPFIFVLRYDLIRIVATEKYVSAGDYIPLLIFFPLLRVMIGVFEQYYLKLADTLFLGVLYIAAIATGFYLGVVLIPLYSIFGAIYASLAAYTLIFVALCLRRKGVIDTEYLHVPALLGLIGLLWVAVYLLELANLPSFVMIVPLGICAVLGVLLLPVLSPQEREKLLGLLKLKRN